MRKDKIERATLDYERRVRSRKEIYDRTVNGDVVDTRSNSFIGDFAEIQQLFGMMASGRNFCLSRERRIGWVPHAARTGDIVSIMPGSPVPFIIRPVERGNSYLMISQYYIHGIIDGEAVAGKEDQFQRIELV